MTKAKLRIGIIGLGIISDAHVQGASEMADIAQIVAVCDIDEQKARAKAAPFDAKVYSDYKKLIREADVDLVDIILPHNLHYEVVMEAIEHGKHVLVEKPLTVIPADGLRLIEKAREKSIIFSVAENTRFVKAYVEVEKLLHANVLGEIFQIRTLIAGSELDRLMKPHPWKGKRDGSGGGAIMDAGPHTFYLLKWLFGEIENVQAFQSRRATASEVEDNGLVVGRMASGAEFYAQFSFTALIPWTERLEIYGSKAAVIIDQICNPPAILYRGTEDYHGEPLSSVPYDPIYWKYCSILHETKDFITTVWENKTPKVDPMDAYYGLRVIEKVYQSVAEGKRITL